jgi:hypothetical protein
VTIIIIIIVIIAVQLSQHVTALHIFIAQGFLCTLSAAHGAQSPKHAHLYPPFPNLDIKIILVLTVAVSQAALRGQIRRSAQSPGGSNKAICALSHATPTIQHMIHIAAPPRSRKRFVIIMVVSVPAIKLRRRSSIVSFSFPVSLRAVSAHHALVFAVAVAVAVVVLV